MPFRCINRSGYQLKLSHFLSTGWGPLYCCRFFTAHGVAKNDSRAGTFVIGHVLDVTNRHRGKLLAGT